MSVQVLLAYDLSSTTSDADAKSSTNIEVPFLKERLPHRGSGAFDSFAHLVPDAQVDSHSLGPGYMWCAGLARLHRRGEDMTGKAGEQPNRVVWTGNSRDKCGANDFSSNLLYTSSLSTRFPRLPAHRGGEDVARALTFQRCALRICRSDPLPRSTRSWALTFHVAAAGS